jgi:hypothetical protein
MTIKVLIADDHGVVAADSVLGERLAELVESETGGKSAAKRP